MQETSLAHSSKDGWSRFVIPDNMVDLFELFTFAVVEELNLKPRLVDFWFYHLPAGGIHCGTNVLQQSPTSGGVLPNVKDAPNIAVGGGRANATA